MEKETTPAKHRGRPLGGTSLMAREARAKALKTGKLPHEILLDIARGAPQYELRVDPETGEEKTVKRYIPLEMRVDAAKAAAPYFAPKISAIEIMSGATEDELDQLIAVLTAEAGAGAGAGGKGEADEEEDGEGDGFAAVGGTVSNGTEIRRRPVTGTRS